MSLGCDVNRKDKNSNTPLHAAVASKNLKVVEAMMDKGGDPLVRNRDGVRAIDMAIDMGGEMKTYFEIKPEYSEIFINPLI